MNKEQARQLYELADRLSKLDVNTLSEEQLAERTAMIARLQEVKQRLDPSCWKGKHKEGTKIKGGVRVNNCVPNESIEEADGEYDDEAGMAKSGLQTMSRAVSGLMDTIQDGDNLPEWAQEKLSLAEDYLTTVWDYLLSQKEQGIEPKVTEASQQVDTLVTDALKLMRGSEVSDAVRALTTVLGNREYNSRRGHYNFYIKQMIDMYNQQGVTEAKKPSPKLTPVNIKKTDPVSEEINTEAYERLQKVFAFKNYES